MTEWSDKKPLNIRRLSSLLSRNQASRSITKKVE